MENSQTSPTAHTRIELRDILKLLPHRYPFLLIDRVLGYEPNQWLTAIKNVTYNEQFFVGHFPQVPTMPGVLLLEAMAQACGLLAVLTSGVRPESGMLLYFAGIDHARFKRPVVPGDQLNFRVEIDKHKRDLWKFQAAVRVDAELACEAEMLCVLKHPDATPRAGI